MIVYVVLDHDDMGQVLGVFSDIVTAKDLVDNLSSDDDFEGRFEILGFPVQEGGASHD
jgi:hypothetical protein